MFGEERLLMQETVDDDRGTPAASATTWRESLDLHIANLDYMARNLDGREVERILDVLRGCQGLVIFTGVGQNSLLASKVASTYGSLSMRSTSIDAVALLHGNLGMLRPQDLLVVLSNSGETFELKRLMEACRDLGHTDTLVVHSAPGCTLEKLAAHSIHLPTAGEADHLGIVPTASSTCFLSFLQAVATQLASENGLTAGAFVRTHPGGTLGGNRWADE
ncbi:SIS domain-containing protein [Micromonospora zamorensis]|uniref:SIS domain-containing protein n=1 Tax=Micromonospora zamorensis TaxID=709883 RepID=UPI003D976646